MGPLLIISGETPKKVEKRHNVLLENSMKGVTRLDTYKFVKVVPMNWTGLTLFSGLDWDPA